MSQVTVSINGKEYDIACDDGQEAHLYRLARYMDQRAQELNAAVGPVADDLLLVMIGLLMADELSDVYGELEDVRAQGGGEARRQAEDNVAKNILTLKERIDRVAQTLKKA